MAVVYEVTICWHPKPHTTVSVQSATFDTLEEAETAAAWGASKLGYETPKWWQYWRWREGRETPRLVARARTNPPKEGEND